ncbi:unnamed protein product, partial [Cylicostephanus goldi]
LVHGYKINSIFVLDETTDVPYERLYETFGRVETISGTLEIINTTFTNLTFFFSLFGLFNYFETGCELDFALTNNCTAIYGILYLLGTHAPSPQVLRKKFGNVKSIVGEIAVVDTAYEKLAFLENMESVQIFYLRDGNCYFFILAFPPLTQSLLSLSLVSISFYLRQGLYLFQVLAGRP